MLKVFHAPRTRSLRVIWMAEELGIPYETVPVEFGAPRSPEFLRVNPAGTLPAMTDGDVRMTESVAVIQYLCDRYGPTPLAVKPDAPNYADYLQFLVLGEAGLAAPLNAVVGTRFFGPPEQQDNFTVGIVLKGFFNRLRLLSRQLEDHAYAAGDDFTAADISCAYPLGIVIHLFKMEDQLPDLVKAYYARCTERPAYQRAVAVQ